MRDMVVAFGAGKLWQMADLDEILMDLYQVALGAYQLTWWRTKVSGLGGFMPCIWFYISADG